jgi:Resolvase, N terminal domain
MALAQAREIDAILVTELSRWGRSTPDLVQTLDDLHSWKVSVLAQTDLSFDLSTASGKLMRTIMVGTVVRLASSGIDETAGSSRPRDEVLADHLRDLPLKSDGELVVLDAFDLAIAEHGMTHRITDRECRRGNNRRRRLGVIVSRGVFFGFVFGLTMGLAGGLRPARYQSRARIASLTLSLVNGFAASRFTARGAPLAARRGSVAVQLVAAGSGGT